MAAFMWLAIKPSAAEAGRWRRYQSVRVVRPVPVYVAPVRVYAPVRRYYSPVNVVAPGVRVNVGGYGYGGVRVNVTETT